MENRKYSVSVEVSKSPKVVFNHITRDVSKYWPEELEGETAALNDEFVFRSGNSHYSKNRVIEFVPDKKVVWLVTDSIRETDNFKWTGTKMIFELTAKGDNTLITFTYDGIVPDNEYNRLVQLCDLIVREKLYNLVESFHTTIEVDQSPQEVFKCICDVSVWWSKEFEGESTNLNDEFVINHPDRHYSKQRLIEVIPGKKLVWLVTESKLNWLERDRTEWTNTKMIFEISTRDEKTVLNFTHEGLVPAKECYSKCEKSWNMVIKDSLFNFISHAKV